MYNNENEIRHEVYRKGRQGKTIKGELRQIRHGKEPRLLVTEYNDELIRKKKLVFNTLLRDGANYVHQMQ